MLSVWSLPSLPRAPPSKSDMFEDFKLGLGNKINCILKENKAVLLERRSFLRQLTEEVNVVKRDIDCTTAAIEQHKEMRETQGTSHVQAHQTLQDGKISVKTPIYILLKAERRLWLGPALSSIHYSADFIGVRNCMHSININQHIVFFVFARFCLYWCFTQKELYDWRR